jgi:hypothetical protein
MNISVTLAPGQVVQRDIELGAFQDRPGKDAAPIRLDKFVVSETQQMEGAAIAINEQRFAPELQDGRLGG